MQNRLNEATRQYMGREVGPHAESLKISYEIDPETGAVLWDFSNGILDAGLRLARVCMAAHGTARLMTDQSYRNAQPYIMVSTDDPMNALFRSQIATYNLSVDGYSAFVSGAARTCFDKRDEFVKTFGGAETPDRTAFFVLEGERPTSAAIRKLAERASLECQQLRLLWSPTRALASIIQVLARVAETGAKKLYELKDPDFDVRCIQTAVGYVPICPKAKDDNDGMALANEASMYGGQVVFTAVGDDAVFERVIAKAVSSAAKNLYGRPFAELIELACADGGFDFAKIKDVFAPAAMSIINAATGKVHLAGALDEAQLRRAFRIGA